MLDKRIKFEESCNKENGTTKMWFTGPKEMLDKKYPEAEFITIQIECPTEYISSSYANVSFSPTKYDKEQEAYTDYYWYDVDMSEENINELIKLAEESGRM